MKYILGIIWFIIIALSLYYQRLKHTKKFWRGYYSFVFMFLRPDICYKHWYHKNPCLGCNKQRQAIFEKLVEKQLKREEHKLKEIKELEEMREFYFNNVEERIKD